MNKINEKSAPDGAGGCTRPTEGGDKKFRVDPSRETYERAGKHLYPGFSYEQYFERCEKINELLETIETLEHKHPEFKDPKYLRSQSKNQIIRIEDTEDWKRRTPKERQFILDSVRARSDEKEPDHR